MLHSDSLKDYLHKQDLSKRDKLLLILAVDIDRPKKVSEIRDLAKSAGLRAIDRWNVSQYFSNSKGMAIHTGLGWELTTKGKKYIIEELKIETTAKVITQTATSLRSHISSISDTDTVNFLNEAVSCFECKNYRAAVVLSWIGAMSLLQQHVFNHHLTAFNSEASRRNSKWKTATSKDDLSRMKESEFLNIIAYLSIIGTHVKQELEKCLRLRNSCGHPSSLVIAEHNVAAHIETLILNVFKKF